MSFWASLSAFLQAMFFLFQLYIERDKAMATKKAVVGKEVIDAFKETDPKIRASRLNAALHSINELRK